MPEVDKQSWLQTVIEGGVPQILLGPAGKALSRLVGAGIEIPASFLDGHAQRIKDRNSARSTLTSAIANRAASLAVEDPKLLDRAIDNLLAKEYRSQKNKDEVAKIAYDSLLAEPAPETSEGPSDQFMTRFEKYAEDATSQNLRELFGRLLAGEIRTPQTIAASTLHFVSMLDTETATLIQRALPHCFQGIALLENIQPALSIAEISFLEQAGFWSSDKTLPFKYDDNGTIIMTVTEKTGFVINNPKGTAFNMKIGLLSRSGRDLLSISDSQFDYEAMATSAYKNEATRFAFGTLSYPIEGEVQLTPQKEFPAPK
uniref:DUF2806 domain-containing protein n=2 Tax=Yoonia sp. TaxID=2212373 RepID=UPI004047A451